MFPYWIGLNARTLMEINSVWLQSTADLMGFFVPAPGQRPAPPLCQSCATPMDSTAIQGDCDRRYLRCPGCGLLGLQGPTTRQGHVSRPGREGIAGRRYQVS